MATPPTYRIRGWDETFETHETRKLLTLHWVAVPNKHDGLGYRRVTSQKDACELFTAWTLMLQIASRGKRGERGVLARDGQALTAEDMALMTGFNERIFARALEFFTEQRQAWLEVIEQSPGVPGENPGPPVSAAAETPLKGREGREGKEGKEERESTAPGPPGRAGDAGKPPADAGPPLGSTSSDPDPEGNGHDEPGTPQDLVEAWNELATSVGLPRATVPLSEKRRTEAKRRLKEHPTSDWWEKVLQGIRGSPFLRGENDRGWRADFDWLLKPGRAESVLEGKYADLGRRR